MARGGICTFSHHTAGDWVSYCVFSRLDILPPFLVDGDNDTVSKRVSAQQAKMKRDSSGSSFICEKCKLISCLTERIIELEVCIRNLEKSRNSERSLDSQLEAPDASGRVSAPSTPAAEPSQRGEWVASRRHRGKAKANAEAKAKANAEAKAKAKAEAKAKANTEAKAKEKAKAGPFKHRSSPVHVSNRFSLLGEKPVEKPVERALVTGDSILPHVKIASPLGAPVAVSCIPGAGAPDIRGNLKMLAIEITKANIKEVCQLAQTMSDAVTCSGPLPVRRGAEIYTRLWSLNCWLSKWCSENNVGFIDNWSNLSDITVSGMPCQLNAPF
ncbi:hypothetical protein NFI96_006742 [Prochilodus magdalenae]|nr:hypothetical protein NFI96_006742 [Prochilodus magdalenae]